MKFDFIIHDLKSTILSYENMLNNNTGVITEFTKEEIKKKIPIIESAIKLLQREGEK